MTKKKKAPPITGTGAHPDNLAVQKSNPLYGLWRSELTLAEFKILDTYLSRINSHEPEKRSVRFEKGEIERLLGVKKINRPELQERLKHLGTMVPIEDSTKPRGFRLVSLFERADCDQDDDGVWQVDLTCTPSALKFIFNVENIGYFRYKLKVVTALRSRYAYVLFLYLEKNRHMHLTWEVSVDELRILLKADNEIYQEFKYFNAKILKPVQKELSEKSDCKFTYEPIRKARTVKAVRFTLEPLSDEIAPSFDEDEQPPEQVQLAEYTDISDAVLDESNDVSDEQDNEQLELLSDACKCEFNRDEMENLLSVLVTVPIEKLPPAPSDVPNSTVIRRYHYLAEKYALMSMYKPKNRFSYLKKIIVKDTKQSD